MQHERLGDLRADAAQRIESRHRLLKDHGDAIAAHRIISPLESPMSSRPSKRTEPETRAPSGVRAISASAVIVLPEPDSPTPPRLSPSPSENDVRSTTRCDPP